MLYSLERCLRMPQPCNTVTTIQEWTQRWAQIVRDESSAFDCALVSGFESDRCGWAFAAGYQASLIELAPGLRSGEIMSLCMTEPSGNRPQDVRTVISSGPAGQATISGAKQWATLSTIASRLLVVAVDDTERQTHSQNGTQAPRLTICVVPANTTGVSIQAMAQTSFVPEVPHGIITLDQVRIEPSSRLPGDGFLDYVRPFRVIEDTYVSVAILGYLLREATMGQWPDSFTERVISTLVTFKGLSELPAAADSTCLAAGGAISIASELYAEALVIWENTAPMSAAAQNWKRDFPLFKVASSIRDARKKSAWRRIRSTR